jgi:L-alanine-DL-glutamate epimerase-like enolase superfamily enzyme
MQSFSRRAFLGSASAALAAPALLLPSCRSAGGPIAPRPAGVKRMRVEEVRPSYQDFLYRTPIKFGGVEVDRVTLLDVEVTVSGGGRTAKGFGSMPMGNIWSFPSKVMGYEDTLGAMKALAGRVEAVVAGCREEGHPIELNRILEPEYLRAAEDISREKALAAPIPKLCALVVASPFDAALHDAFGKLNGVSCYRTYGPDLLEHDLARYLGPDWKGERLGQYVFKAPRPRMPLYHLVGAVDPIVDADVKRRVGDGLPETVPEWIRRNGLTHLKIKLNGEDLGWDVERVVRVDRTAAETQGARGVARWYYSLDFNEKCSSVAYLLEFLAKVREAAPAAFDRIQYIEQPTARDLKANRANVMHEASRLKPVVIDESLTDLESLLLAREMGYTGAALKACKGQSGALLMAAAAQKHGMFLCVQDLTCPGASLIHSAGLAAHVPGVQAIEANSRQYVPAANAAWEARFPGIFAVKDGMMETVCLDGPGLGAV